MISSQRLPHSLTAILVARFQLDLQAANRKAVDIGTLSDEQGDGPHSHSGTRSLIFERAVGSLAALVSRHICVQKHTVSEQNVHETSSFQTDFACTADVESVPRD